MKSVGPKREIVCFGCGKEGHRKSECPRAKNRLQKIQIVSKDVSQLPSIWLKNNKFKILTLLDTGATGNFLSLEAASQLSFEIIEDKTLIKLAKGTCETSEKTRIILRDSLEKN